MAERFAYALLVFARGLIPGSSPDSPSSSFSLEAASILASTSDIFFFVIRTSG